MPEARQRKCSYCKGTGRVPPSLANIEGICPVCKGKGWNRMK